VFAALLDVFKAFDKTNHKLQFAKLLKRNVPIGIARLLMSWYGHQTMLVKWDTNFSSPFTVTNEVNQGGDLSFCFYLDELTNELGSARVGCTVGNMVVNHLINAYDICVQP